MMAMTEVPVWAGVRAPARAAADRAAALLVLLDDAAARGQAMEPWHGLEQWLRRFADAVAGDRATADGIARDLPEARSLARSVAAAGTPLLARAQEAGVARLDADIADVVRLIALTGGGAFRDAAQHRRVLGLAIDGIRAR